MDDVTIAAHDAGALNEIEVDFGYPEVVLASVGEEDGRRLSHSIRIKM